jgi:hypothetical protein
MVPAALSFNITLPLGAMLPLNNGFRLSSAAVHVEPGDETQVIVIGVPTVAVLLLAEMVAVIGATPQSATT